MRSIFFSKIIFKNLQKFLKLLQCSVDTIHKRNILFGTPKFILR